MSAFVMTVDHTDETRADEADADEVAALAAVLAHHGHLPVPREDEVEVALERVDGPEDVRPLLPRQRDEFACRSCFLVAHVSRRAALGIDICTDCS